MEKRTLLALGLILVVLYLSNKYIYTPPAVREMPPEALPPEEVKGAEAESSLAGPGITLPTIPQGEPVEEVAETTKVETNKFRLHFSSRGGALIGATLKDYDYLPSGAPVELIRDERSRFLSMSLSVRKDTLNLENARYLPVERNTIPRAEGAEQILTFVTVVGDNDTVKTTYTFADDSYLVRATLDLPAIAKGSEGWKVHQYLGPSFRPTEKDSMKEDFPNIGAAFLKDEKVEERKMTEFKAGQSEYVKGPIPWVVMRNKYFMVGLISRNLPYEGAVVRGDKDARSFGVNPMIALPAGETSVSYEIYIGPQDYRSLKTVGLGLEKMVEYGWFIIRPFTRLILVILLWLHKFIHNYGLVIILFSALTKLVFYPLTKKSLQATKDMQKLQPLMKELREKYKSDPRKLQEETLRLYKEHKVNPLGGCLPLLIQMPVLWALFYVFQRTIEFRGAEFVLWIRDLSAPDSPPVLPIIMGVSMWWQQRMTPTTDPRMAPMQYIMPIVLTILFISFPAGLVLYWTVNNLLSILQQYVMQRNEVKIGRGVAKAAKGAKRGEEPGEGR